MRRGLIFAVITIAVLNNGCWGRKFFRAPGVTMETSAKVDSLIDANMTLQRRVYSLEQAVSGQKEYSRSVNAQRKLDLEELKDQMNVIMQMLDESGSASAWKPPKREVVAQPRTGQEATRPDSSSTGHGVEIQPDSSAIEPAAAIPGPEEMYRQLYLDFSRMEYQLAIEESDDFFREYPDHPLGEQVRFIRGECYIEMEKYFDALKEFSSILQQYPQGKKIPSALLRMAVSYHNIGDDDLAAGIARRLLREYPGSEEAAVAREQFGEILGE
ncbi:MAG: tetratricopeptide repeat protein [Candidatus Krumholzibacteriota bacterium]|nr:tetratricopeptide repeat protein [Candidatus Krumholzibacteriota bacterium]